MLVKRNILVLLAAFSLISTFAKSQKSVAVWQVDTLKSEYFFKKQYKDSIYTRSGKPSPKMNLYVDLKSIPPYIVKNFFFDNPCEGHRGNFDFYKNTQGLYVDYHNNWITLTIIKSAKGSFEFTITHTYPEKRKGSYGEYKTVDYYKCKPLE